MADYLIHDSTLEDIADAIRAKTGGSALINPEDMASEIASIETGSGDSPITKDTWTLASDYNTTTQGFFYGTYTDRGFVGLQVFHIDNNEATSHKATTAYIVSENRAPLSARTGFRRIYNDNPVWTGASAGIEFKMTAGTVITRYKIFLN